MGRFTEDTYSYERAGGWSENLSEDAAEDVDPVVPPQEIVCIYRRLAQLRDRIEVLERQLKEKSDGF